MPVPDDEPQYWLRDSNGDVVGALYLDADGNPSIVDENGNEASLEGDGTWDVPAVSTGQSLTDPAGVEHTGELADASDLSSGSGVAAVDSPIFTGAMDAETLPTAGPHDGLSPVLFDTGSKLVMIYRNAPEHGFDGSETLRAIDSPDYGDTWQNDREIYSEANTDSGGMVGRVMNNGRLGAMFYRRDSNNNLAPGFIYSDDDGSTWTSTILSLPAGGGNGDMLPYPSSVGGDDNTGFVVIYQDSGSIRLASTVDNGDTWTDEGTVVSPSFEAMEPSMARLGTQDKWVMVIRDDNDGSTMKAATSTDLTSWSSATDTGQVLSSNRPRMVYENGTLWVITTSRLYHRSGREIEDYGDSILIQSGDAEEVFTDLTAWNGWVELSEGVTGNLGYPDLKKIRGRWYMAISVNEPDNWESADVALFSPKETEVGASSSGSTSTESTLVYSDSDQSISADTQYVKLSFNTVRHDSDGNFDSSADTITVGSGGYYQINVNTRVDGLPADANFNTSVGINGSNTDAGIHYLSGNGASSIFQSGVVSSVVELSAGDSLAVYGSNFASSTSVTVGGDSSNLYTYFSVTKLG